ncbi:MAG: putative selenium-dependent hydroxylase accessory protein YqeC [Chloroflexi bacterium]|nr:putative selenium-dependent hydroxylase accessory protein YqeC [Chloroflexota bacterium]
MQLLRALRVSQAPCIAFAGAGGKTTALFQIARQFKQPVIVTATTHLGTWQIPLADQHITASSPDNLAGVRFDGVTLVTSPLRQDNRTDGVSQDTLFRLRAEAKEHNIPLLIEADGARQKPLKAPAAHEPVIPDFVDTVVVIAGLSGLGKPLTDETVHRPETFAKLSGLKIGEAITSDALMRLLTHPDGGLKNIPPQARQIVLLNQADTPELQSIGGKMANALLGKFNSVICGTLEPLNLQTLEHTAGIILAAGESKRFGRPKQLLDWRGQPFVRVAAQAALDVGLFPVIVVTGSHADEVEAALRGLPVKAVMNEDWQNGQGSSIRKGVQSLPPETGSAIFLLADQPQIRADVIRALAAHHATELYPIVAPLVLNERRANPVLFDRVTFPDLLTLSGDVGGRAIFDKHRVEYLPWHDDRLLLDVDKPEDYRRLIEDDTL